MPCPPKQQRLAWLDTLKAIGLFSVVLGHTDGISHGVRTYIYSFHIPLFFFIAGYLVSPTLLQNNFTIFAHKYLRALILPYLGFGAVTYLIWLCAGRFYGRDILLAVPPLKPMAGMVYGIGVDHWLRHNVALWFFPALFSLHCLYYWLRRVSETPLVLVYGVIGMSLIGCLAGQLLSFRLPWSIEPACVGVIFYGAGRLVGTRRCGPRQIGGSWRIPIMIGCLALQVAAIQTNGRVDMNELVFGNPAAFYLAAFGGIGFWSLASTVIPATKAATAIAREAMVIFPLHTLVFSLVTLVAIHWLPWGLTQHSSLAAGVYTAVVFVVLVPGAPLIRRICPWLD